MTDIGVMLSGLPFEYGVEAIYRDCLEDIVDELIQKYVQVQAEILARAGGDNLSAS
jgi:hypothetical protein